MAEILVRGQAEARVVPTGAALTVTVRVAQARTQAEAVAQAGSRCEVVDDLIDERRDALVVAAVQSSLRTGPEWDYSAGKGRRLLGYTATRTTEVECVPDGPLLTEMVGDLAGLEDVSVAGPRWLVAPDADGLDAVRSAAAADARRRAEAYAGGLGQQVGRVAWIAEPGLRIAGQGSGVAEVATMASTRSFRAAVGGGAEEEEPSLVRIVPEPVVVSATVEVAFDLVDR